MYAIDINIIINDNAVCAIEPASFIIVYRTTYLDVCTSKKIPWNGNRTSKHSNSTLSTLQRSICPYTASAADTKHSNLLYNVLADSPWLGFTQIGH